MKEHTERLVELLDGKDARRVSTKARGTALLVLSDEEGGLHRITIDMTGKKVSVTEAARLPHEGRLAVVKAELSDWLRFFHHAGDETLSALRLYGDVEILAALGELFVVNRSFIDIRAGGGL